MTLLNLSKQFEICDYKSYYLIQKMCLSQHFQFYLKSFTKKLQFVQFINNCSTETNITRGEPQGSLLFQILFIFWYIVYNIYLRTYLTMLKHNQFSLLSMMLNYFEKFPLNKNQLFLKYYYNFLVNLSGNISLKSTDFHDLKLIGLKRMNGFWILRYLVSLKKNPIWCVARKKKFV